MEILLAGCLIFPVAALWIQSNEDEDDDNNPLLFLYSVYMRLVSGDSLVLVVPPSTLILLSFTVFDTKQFNVEIFDFFQSFFLNMEILA